MWKVALLLGGGMLAGGLLLWHFGPVRRRSSTTGVARQTERSLPAIGRREVSVTWTPAGWVLPRTDTLLLDTEDVAKHVPLMTLFYDPDNVADIGLDDGGRPLLPWAVVLVGLGCVGLLAAAVARMFRS